MVREHEGFKAAPQGVQLGDLALGTLDAVTGIKALAALVRGVLGLHL